MKFYNQVTNVFKHTEGLHHMHGECGEIKAGDIA